MQWIDYAGSEKWSVKVQSIALVHVYHIHNII